MPRRLCHTGNVPNQGIRIVGPALRNPIGLGFRLALRRKNGFTIFGTIKPGSVLVLEICIDPSRWIDMVSCGC
jgi:hypothetical protein